MVKDTNILEAGHILIVEDDYELGILLSEIVRQRYDVTLVANAKEALTILENTEIDLLLLDIMLADMDGFELLSIVRETYPAQTLSIIIISALDDARSIVRGFEIGANDYIVKPVESSVLLARLETQLRLSRLQRENERYIAHLEKTDQLRQQLSQIASHDLKNPINNLRMAESLLREEIEDVPRVESLLSTMNASLDMMETVVEAFLDMVAIQTNTIKLKQEPVHIRDVINNACAQYELVAEKKNIRMVVGDSEGIIIADAGRMAQIAGNLVSNAIKYSPRDDDILIWSEQINGTLRLNVMDNGAGVPEKERDKLFKEFSKLSSRPTGGESSTGLGLWIVTHLIELQGGRAGADFPEEGGSIFWVEMPLADNSG